jgi:hypothetical protein
MNGEDGCAWPCPQRPVEAQEGGQLGPGAGIGVGVVGEAEDGVNCVRKLDLKAVLLKRWPGFDGADREDVAQYPVAAVKGAAATDDEEATARPDKIREGPISPDEV